MVPPEIANFEERDINDGVLFAQLPEHEGHQAENRSRRKADHQARREPVVLLADIEHDLQAAHAQNHQRQAHGVYGQLACGGLALGVDRHRADGGNDAHGDVDVENPRPADVVGDPAAQERPHHRRDQRGHGPHRHRQARQRLGVAGEQQRLRQRNHRPGDEALHHARRDQERHAGREAAEEGGGDEEQHAEHEQAHLPEALRQPAGERHRDGVGHGKAGDRRCPGWGSRPGRPRWRAATRWRSRCRARS